MASAAKSLGISTAVLLLLVAAWVAAYLVRTEVTSLSLLVERRVVRTCDKDVEYYLYYPLALLEGVLRSPDEFTFRVRSGIGL